MRIAIIGMGLIGTSLGMALRSANEHESLLGALHITGYDADQRATSAAHGRLAIDKPARSLPAAVQDAQLIILATPVQTIRDILEQLAPLLGPGSIVTDTASTKARICAWARELLPAGVDFVGGHPMAGKEQAGPQAADADLFRGSIYCLVPAPEARPQAVDTMQALVLTAGARPYYIDADEHDAYVAGISHLPFLLSRVLVAVTSRSPAWKEMAPLAASGFRDVSRLASGDPVMHRDICMTNRTALLRWIDETIALLSELRSHLDQQDADQLTQLFQATRQQREAWLHSQPHLRPGEEQVTALPPAPRRGLFGFLWPPGSKDKH